MWIPNHKLTFEHGFELQDLTEKDQHISGPMQFKPLLFKCQLYIRFGTTLGFRHPLGNWNVFPEDKGQLPYLNPQEYQKTLFPTTQDCCQDERRK